MYEQGDSYVVNNWTEQVNWGHELYVTVMATEAMYVMWHLLINGLRDRAKSFEGNWELFVTESVRLVEASVARICVLSETSVGLSGE